MTGLGIQTWVLPLIGIRSALAHSELMEVLEVIHILGNSYRLASLGVGSGIVYGRFTLDFCRTVAASIVWNVASPRSVFPTFRMTSQVGLSVSPQAATSSLSNTHTGYAPDRIRASRAMPFRSAFERHDLNGPSSLQAWTVPTGYRDLEDNSWLIG
jgi:hypothetical protein